MNDNIIQIGDFSLARENSEAKSRRGEACAHRRLDLDQHGEVVRCRDCGTQVSAFWALGMLATFWRDESARLQSRLNQAQKDLDATLHLRAAKTAEQAWRNRDMVPTCPHCGEGISPADGFGRSLVSKRIDEARREARKKGRQLPAPLGMDAAIQELVKGQ